MKDRNSKMISSADVPNMRYGRITVGTSIANAPGIIRKALPLPVWRPPSTSSIIPHTSVMSRNEIDKSSFAFIAQTYHANQNAVMNWNARGQLNA